MSCLLVVCSYLWGSSFWRDSWELTSNCCLRLVLRSLVRCQAKWHECTLQGTHHSTWHMHFQSWHLLQSIANLSFVCFIRQNFIPSESCLLVSYPAMLFTMLMGFLNRGSVIVHGHLPGTSKVFTLSAFLPGIQQSLVVSRDATFQEISWNQEISDRKKQLQEKWNSVSRL